MVSVETWAERLGDNLPPFSAAAFSWRDARRAAELATQPSSMPVTLIGHSMGGGCAQLIAQRLPAGSIETLITVAPFAPREVKPHKVRAKVGYWLNIVSARSWQSTLLGFAGRCFLGWRDQGPIVEATENHFSGHPHRDFYRLISGRCGPVEHGNFVPPEGALRKFASRGER